MKNLGKSCNTKIIIDILMTIFLILSFVRWQGDSGLIFHALVGSACIVLFALHFCIHWKWVKSVSRSFFAGKISKKLRWKYPVNMLLLLIWSIVAVSGVFAIGYFSAEIESMALFSRLHAVTSRVGLVLIIIHILQHLPQIKSYLGFKRKPKSVDK